MATFALVTTVGPQPRPARSTPGEPGRAADRQAFASLSYPTNRQVLRNPHVGRPGFLVSTSIHPRTAVRRGRHAGLLLTPCCQRHSARSRIHSVRQCRAMLRPRTLVSAKRATLYGATETWAGPFDLLHESLTSLKPELHSCIEQHSALVWHKGDPRVSHDPVLIYDA